MQQLNFCDYILVIKSKSIEATFSKKIFSLYRNEKKK